MREKTDRQGSAQNIFEQSSIPKIYFTMAMPVTLGMVFSVIYNVADTFFIAQTQNTSLVAGVSLCAPVFTLLMAMGNIFGQGGTSLISRLFGKQDTEGTRRVSSFCFYGALATGAVIGILMLLFARSFLGLLGTTDETYRFAREYYLVLAAGAPVVVANFIHMNLLRAEGMSRESMIGNVSGLLVNIILDPLFISVFGWGAFGAAFASVLGYAFSVVFMLVILRKKSRILSVDPRIARIPAGYVAQIFSIGVSAALTNIMSSICMILLNHFLLPYGNDKIAAMGIAQKNSMIVMLILVGMSFGSAPIIGYFYGGKQYGRLKDLLRFQFTAVGGVAVVLTAVLFALARPCISLFLKEESIIHTGTLMLRFQISTMLLAAAMQIITICFQATGKAKEALLASVCRQGIVFFPVLLMMSRLFGYTGILASQAVSDILSVLLLGVLFWKRFVVPVFRR